MTSKALALLLIGSLLAPLNSGAAAWMALSMDAADNAMAEQPHHQAPMGHHSSHADGHDDSHDEDDCEEHCFSCTNHCSSLGIVSGSIVHLDLTRQLSALEVGLTSNYSDLLYRPPIHL